MSKLKRGDRVKCSGCDHTWRPRLGGQTIRPDKKLTVIRPTTCPRCGKGPA